MRVAALLRDVPERVCRGHRQRVCIVWPEEVMMQTRIQKWAIASASLDGRVRKASRISTVPADVLQEAVGKLLALIDPDGLR